LPPHHCRRSQDFFDAPIDFHVDAQYHFIHQLSINFWTPLTACGKDAPAIKVLLLGVQETKDYLEFDEAGYAPQLGDIDNMRHFRCDKMRFDNLQEHELVKYIWAPEFEKGDILAFTNFTMHAPHYLPELTQGEGLSIRRLSGRKWSVDRTGGRACNFGFG